MFQVTASNRLGDFTIEVFDCPKQAKIRHKQLWNEVDDRGMMKWGTVRTTDIERCPQEAA